VVIYGAMRIALPALTLLLTATPALAQGLTVERLPRRSGPGSSSR